MNACTEDLTEYAEAKAEADFFEAKAKELRQKSIEARKRAEGLLQGFIADGTARDRAEADGIIETSEERHARLLWYLNPCYTVSQFASLYFGVIPGALRAVPLAILDAIRKLSRNLREVINGIADELGFTITTDGNGEGLYPVAAFRLACGKIGRSLDRLVFTFRTECTREELQRQHEQCRTYKPIHESYSDKMAQLEKSMKRGRTALKDDAEKMAVVQQVAEEADWFFETVTDFATDVAEKGGIDGASTAKDWVAAWMKTHPGMVTIWNKETKEGKRAKRRFLKPVLSGGI